MSNQFNFKRFSLLFKKHTVEHYKTYLLSIVVLFGIITISTGIMTRWGIEAVRVQSQLSTFLVIMLFSGTIFTSNIFINLSDKRKAVAMLILPASAFEKFLVGWVYSYLFFQILFTAIFYANMWLFLPKNAPVMDIFSAEQYGYVIYLAFAFFNAATLYGAVYFKKAHFIKTAFTLFVISYGILGINNILLKTIVPIKSIRSDPLPFTGISFMSHHKYYELHLSDTIVFWVCALFMVVSFMIWAATYFRLKEKQI